MRRTVIFILTYIIATNAIADEISCYSQDYEYTHCALPNADKLNLRLKIDRQGGCKKNNTWGVDQKGVWVDYGCQATFRYKSMADRGWFRKFISPIWNRRTN